MRGENKFFHPLYIYVYFTISDNFTLRSSNIDWVQASAVAIASRAASPVNSFANSSDTGLLA